MNKLPLLLIALISSAGIARESGPSNTVGLSRITCGANGFTAFGLGFVTWQVPTAGIPTYGVRGYKPSDIIGDQAMCGSVGNADRIISQGVGSTFAWRASSSGCVWANTLETGSKMRSGKAYWYRNFQPVAREIDIAGEANIVSLPDSVIVMGGTESVRSWTPYSWRDPRARNRENLQLLQGQMFPDLRVVDQTPGGTFFMWSLESGWWGLLTAVTPGRAYWIGNRWTTFTYQYDPTSDASLSIPPRGDEAKVPVMERVKDLPK